MWNYNCRDAIATYEADDHMTQVLEDEGLTEQYAFQMRQLNELALPMMLRGVKIDTNQRSKIAMELMEAIAEFETRLLPLVPEEILPRKKGAASWYRSPKQLATLFYDELGIKPVKSVKGRPTTGKLALPIIAKREPIVKPIIDAIGKLRSLNVFYGTFVQAKLDPDDRMRCSFNIAGTETFRWSSSANAWDRGTNLQNIPSGDEDTQETRGVRFPNIRKFFIPDPGYLIVDPDLSGADAQVVAWESGEDELKSALRAGIKLHSVVAKELYGSDGFPHYDMCKRRIHATNYGGGVPTLHKTLLGLYGPEHTSEAIEREFQEYWFDKYPGVKHWHERTHTSLDKYHGVQNKFGNRIIYFDRLDSVFNRALAWVPQSTVALVCVRGMLELQDKFPFVELLLQVHDSCPFQIPLKYRDQLRDMQEVLNAVEIPYDDPLRIPWKFKVSSKSWGDGKEMES